MLIFLPVNRATPYKAHDVKPVFKPGTWYDSNQIAWLQRLADILELVSSWAGLGKNWSPAGKTGVSHGVST